MDHDSNSRLIELDDKSIADLIQERSDLINQGLECARVMQEHAEGHKKAEDRNNELLAKANKVKLAILKKAKKCAQHLLTSYEAPVTTKIIDGKVYLEVTDMLEAYRSSFKDFNPWEQAIPTKK